MILNPTTNIIDSSKINDFIKCPRYYFYSHILGWKPEGVNNHLLFGSAFHLALEHLMTNGYDDVVGAYNKMLGRFRTKISPEEDELFEPKTMNNALIVLAKYAKKYYDDLQTFNVLHTEIAGSVSIGLNRQVYFRLDSLIKDLKSGRISSIEHKTGSSTYLWLDQWMLSIQIGTYTHVLNCLYPGEELDSVIINGVFFFKAKGAWKDLNTTGETKLKLPYDFIREKIRKTKDQMEVWLWTVNYFYGEILRHMEKLEKDENLGVMECFPMRHVSCRDYNRLCEYHNFCTAWPNPLHRCDQVPLGFHQEFWNPMEEEAKLTVTL